MLRHYSGTSARACLVGLEEYLNQEGASANQSSVSDAGVLLEYETLELRIHPPNVDIDNQTHEHRTIVTLDSANRPGTLVELVQCLTELGLNVPKARISSDGGWFLDQFEVTDKGGKVSDASKLAAIHRVLSPLSAQQQAQQAQPIPEAEEERSSSTVVELLGRDRVGLLSDVLSVMKVEAKVWAGGV